MIHGPDEWDARTLSTRPIKLCGFRKGNRATVNQQTIFTVNLGIFRHISRNVKVRKNLK
jgi:hypothetical protein